MENIEEIEMVNELENLNRTIKNMNLPQYNKEKILSALEFEIQMIKHALITKLGNQEFDKIKNTRNAG